VQAPVVVLPCAGAKPPQKPVAVVLAAAGRLAC